MPSKEKPYVLLVAEAIYSKVCEIKKKCKKIILGCTELPIAIFAYKPFKTIKSSKIFLDPNLILANAAMRKYQNR